MNYLNNKTISHKIVFFGKPLHSDQKTFITLIPAIENSGIRINYLPLRPDYITDTSGMTTHGSVSQIEHLMSALYALGINDLEIEVKGSELPVMDGCSYHFVEKIKEAGITVYPGLKKMWYPVKEIEINIGDSYIKYIPWPDKNNISTQFICQVDFPYVGKQEFCWNSLDYQNYEMNIANAVTFFWDIQFRQECEKGKCLGVDNKNCMVYNKDTRLENNELARHKLLDLIGDLNTLNMIIPGKFIAYKPGHRVNNTMARKMWLEFNNSCLNLKQLPIIQKNETKKINVVLIGYGKMGQNHFKEIQNNKLFHLIGIIDPMLPDKNIYKIHSISDAKEMGAEAAIIASSTKTHYLLTKECIKNQIHILVEKPAFLLEQEFNDIIFLSKKYQVSVAVGMIERYNPIIYTLKNINLDKIKSVLIKRICKIPNNKDTSLLLYDLLIHDLDLVQLYFGKMTQITKSVDKDMIFIKGYVNGIIFHIQIGYSDLISIREIVIKKKNKQEILINMVTDQHLLKFEHNDWFNYLVNNKYNISTLQECYNITKQIMSIESNTYNKNLQSV
jgi:UDP-3-O-[3-hydroxymyristoyl] N-acetylglucosamine deacetylase